MTPLALAGPVGLNPALAIALFGLAVTFGIVPPVPGLEPMFHPAMAMAFMLAGVALHVGRSGKLTKPVAEAAGVVESLLGVVITGLLFFNSPPAQGMVSVTEAGLGSTMLWVGAGVTSVLSVIVLRTALDVLIWATPIPFVDGLFQVVKLALTLGLVALAIFLPTVAVFFNLAILILTFLAMRWALRTARFGLELGYDLTLGLFEAEKTLPVDPVAAEDLGPFTVFALEIPGVKRRTHGTLELTAGRWIATFPRFLGEPRRITLGESKASRLDKGLTGTTLDTAGGSLLLPPRYRHLFVALVAATGADTPRRPAQPHRAWVSAT